MNIEECGVEIKDQANTEPPPNVFRSSLKPRCLSSGGHSSTGPVLAYCASGGILVGRRISSTLSEK